MSWERVMATSLAELRAIFCEALDCQTAAERARYLDRACNGNPTLRSEVETLLAAHDDAGALPAEATAGADTVLESAPLGPGAAFGQYRLIEKLGEGGFALVFLAEQHPPFHRQVAIKVLKQGVDDPQVIARFKAESQALALMEHPNIAHVFDSGIISGASGAPGSGRPYLVMELCRGTPLSDYCKTHQVPLESRLELFISVCLAVQHAHLKGIIHRDLKPSNVLVIVQDNQPVIKLIDFGIAKAMEQQWIDPAGRTRIAQIIGTPLYMSPEQTQTGCLDIDTRTDVYSLGVLLYELLTGTTPFEADRLQKAGYDEMRRIIREEEPRRPSQRLRLQQRGAMQELDWIVMKALEKDRSRRYMTANALANDVRRYLDHEPVLACPPSAWYRLGKLARRNKGALLAAALIALTLVGGTAASLWQAVRATAAMHAEQEAALKLENELDNTRQAEVKATRELFEALVAQARATRLSRRRGQRFGTLEIVRKATAIAHKLQLPEERFVELRNEALAALALADLRVDKDREWARPVGAVIHFDPKLARYASAEVDGTVYIRRVGDGTEIGHLPNQEPTDCIPQFSPDGRFLAVNYPRRARLEVWTVPSMGPMERVKLPDETGRPNRYTVFSPDGRQAAIGDAKEILDLVDLTTGKTIQSHKVAGKVACAFDPEGRRLAVAAGGFVQVLDLPSGQFLSWKQVLSGTGSFVTWHPNGKALAVCQERANTQDIVFWDTATGNRVGVLQGMSGGGPSCAFNQDGTLLASNGQEAILRLWDVRTIRQVFSMSGVRGGQFSADGRLLATGESDDKLRILEIAVGSEYRTLLASPLPGKKLRYLDSAISPDGRWLAAGTNGGAGLWDLASGNNVVFLDAPGAQTVSLKPAGSLLTMSKKGFLRRPIEPEPATGMLQLGETEKLPIPGSALKFAQSADGNVSASPQSKGAFVVFADQPGRMVHVGPHAYARHVAVSPDGSLVATGGFGLPGDAKVWEVGTGQLKAHLRVGTSCRVAFSPDGQRLLTGIGNGQIRVWDAATWAEIPMQVPLRCSAVELDRPAFPVAFSADCKLLAVETGAGVARFLDPTTGKELARLEDPNQHQTEHFTFSHDGTKLVCASGNGFCLHVWDLQALRRQLAEMGLDWRD
jgi:eukaryotic-like serine/threonine-protein kinase